MRKLQFLILLVVSVLFFGACSETQAPSTSGAKQLITGQAALSTFPDGVTGVRVVQGAEVIATGDVASDGTFSLNVPKGVNYRVEILQNGEPVTLVFPRAAGGVEGNFDVKGAGTAFNLGTVRYIGDPSASTFRFKRSTSQLMSEQADPGATDPGATDPGATDPGATDPGTTDPEMNEVDEDEECEDGVDSTGAICIDDDHDDDDGGICEDDGEDEHEDAEDGTEGEEETAEAEDEEEPVITEAAVPEHNIPEAVGCENDDDDDDDHDDDHDDRAETPDDSAETPDDSIEDPAAP